MRLIVTRFLTLPTSYASEVTLNSTHICYAIDRLVGDRGIPDGVYTTEITYSPRFKRQLPLINVPGREGMRFHSGNWISQSDGCVITGTSLSVAADSVSTSYSRKALALLMDAMRKYGIKQCEFRTL